MASTSSSSIQKSFKYDVFLSFRGEDTRNSFVGHLYQALKQKGIETYKDDEKIEQGEKINDQLMRSIQESRFFIIVFSKTYASSSWCLDELVKIMECRKTGQKTAFPVFYDVEPTEVRKQKGLVGKAFSIHENKAAAGKWREAMKEASNLAGWELKKIVNGDESKLIQIIVDNIFRKLCFISLSIDGNLVGMEMRKKEVLSSLDIGTNDVRVIGIKGMGGSGKTTLARAVYDQISTHFEGKSFVENVREVSKTPLSGLKTLQEQILRDVFDDRNISISGVSDGKKMMIQMMCRKKVLVVLDDVDHSEQLEALVNDFDNFKSGSRIIITTRDEQVLVSHGVCLICNVNLLTDEEAVCLFRRYAFGKEIPNQGFNEMSGQVLRYAAGLPLTIKVLGSSLRGKSELEWKDDLERLKTIPQQDTQKKLEMSYDTLDSDQKEIFLDVACILKGEQKDKAIRVLESCGLHGRIGLRVLEQKCLINVSQSGSLGMHDLIEEMGKNVVRQSHPNEPNRDSRLWIEEKVEDILLDNDLVNETIRCIKLSQSKLKFETVMRGLRNMKKLRVLYMCSGANWNDSKVRHCFPDSLQYLSWRSYPFLSLHVTFQADNLVGLDMSFSSIAQIWEGGKRKVLNKLRFLDLSYSKLTILNLEVTPKLEILNLEHCTDLKELYIPYGCPKLQYLNLDFSNLKNLSLGPTPDLDTLSLGGCSNLLQLHMPRCPKLTVLKLNGSELRTLELGLTLDLETLSLERCNLAELHMPSDCPKLKFISFHNSKLKTLDLRLTPNLERLDLKDCSNLVDINAPDGCLEKLVYVDLSGCGRYKSFLFDKRSQSPEVGCLSELHVIAEPIDRCPMHPVNNLPKFQFTCFYQEDPAASSFGNLEKLISIGQCVCANFESLTRSICSLNFLRKLTLEGSILEVVKDLHHLECLEDLTVSNTEITHVPYSVCRLKQLKSLKLQDCQHLEELTGDFGLLESLEELILANIKIKRLPDGLCMMKQLKSLKLESCWDLEKLPVDFDELDSLEELILANIIKIERLLDDVCMLKQLKSLKLESCQDLKRLPTYIGRLKSLEELILLSTGIESLPDSVCMLKQLKFLKLQDCQRLIELPKDFGLLESLEELTLFNLSILYLPDSICMLKQLKFLKLQDCQHLMELPEDFGLLESLEELTLFKSKISNLPNSVCTLRQLKSLKLESCPDLERLPKYFGKLESLEELILLSTGIERLSYRFCRLKKLKFLKLQGRQDLMVLPKDFGLLKSLEELSLANIVIKRLPDSVCMLKQLKSLKLESTRIESLPNGICKLKRPKYFHLLDCTVLDDLPEKLGHLKCLEELDITGTDISHLPQSIFQLKGLHIIGFKRTLELCGLTPVKRASNNGDYETFCYTVVNNYFNSTSSNQNELEAQSPRPICLFSLKQFLHV